MIESAIASAPFNKGRNGATDATSLVNLNTTIKTVFEIQKERLQLLQPILRCDALPSVKGDKSDLIKLFTTLTDIILEHPPFDSKLFIYIKCEEDAVTDASNHTISLHANTGSNGQWEKAYANLLAQCGSICNKIGGQFVYHMMSASICLFTLILPDNSTKNAC